ncbi:hypothetical protein F5B20DRAFT_122539 [Whalleya microplaca]|nr:hypothetical protein F5B20DRAFT_122539 [Whalleya microplaca]
MPVSPSPPTQSPDQMATSPAPASPESTWRPNLSSPPDIKITAATPIDGRPETPPEEKIIFNSVDRDNLPELVTDDTRPGSARGDMVAPSPSTSPSPKPETTSKHDSRRYSEATLPEAVKQDVIVPDVVEEAPALPPRNEKLLSTDNLAEGYRPNTQAMLVAEGGRNTVTPLHLLGDQPDTIDCPFCQYRVVTRVERVASRMTKIAGAICFFTTVIGTCVPCWAKWYYDIDQYCGNCDRKVTHRGYADQSNVVYGTPEHLRQVSRFPPAPHLEEQLVPGPEKKSKRK